MHGLAELVWSNIFAELGCFDHGGEVVIGIKQGKRFFQTAKGSVILDLEKVFTSYTEAEDEVRNQLYHHT